jgi:hypothetical protein
MWQEQQDAVPLMHILSVVRSCRHGVLHGFAQSYTLCARIWLHHCYAHCWCNSVLQLTQCCTICFSCLLPQQLNKLLPLQAKRKALVLLGCTTPGDDKQVAAAAHTSQQ